MSATAALRANKSKLMEVLAADYSFILTKAQEKLITQREYNNLKSINRMDVSGHVVEFLDKIMNKGEKTCRGFLDLLQTDEVLETFPGLKDVLEPADAPADAPAARCGEMLADAKRPKKEELYELNSHPVGLCLIINNENFQGHTQRGGTNKDAESLAEVFSWLGFRVLMCKDQTVGQMEQTLKSFASLCDAIHLQGLDVQEWSGCWRPAPQQLPKHGDAFVCCIMSHGSLGNVFGIDSRPLAIKEIRRYFNATKQSALTGKPKVFLIQACQGNQKQQGVLEKDVEEDGSTSIPQEADMLVAISTVEDFLSFRNKIEGSWFIQSVCEQLKEHCPSGEEITSILHRVHFQVGQKEGSDRPGKVKQAPELRSTLRKKLVLSPHST